MTAIAMLFGFALWISVPVVACAVTPLTAEERDCCEEMGPDCGQSAAAPQSDAHDCCRTEVHSQHAPDALTAANTPAAPVILSRVADLPAAMAFMALRPAPEPPFAEWPPGASFILRI